MEATAQVSIKKVPGSSPTQLEAKIDEIFSSGNLPDGIDYKVMSAQVDDFDADADDEDNNGTVGIEMTVEEKALVAHFGAEDAEDEKNEAGFKSVLEAALEKATDGIEDAEFEVEDCSVSE